MLKFIKRSMVSDKFMLKMKRLYGFINAKEDQFYIHVNKKHLDMLETIAIFGIKDNAELIDRLRK